FELEPPSGSCAHFHAGYDLAAPFGATVRAVRGGTVHALAPAGIGGGYGWHVVITQADGIEALYGHLEAIAVAEGATAAAGEVIGFEGSTGLSTGPHLHFEVRRAGRPLDPAEYLPELFMKQKHGREAAGTVPCVSSCRGEIKWSTT
ncbi:MAG: M23 family metallopeptidase, partial [Candidatus Dormibacteria bacterium]